MIYKSALLWGLLGVWSLGVLAQQGNPPVSNYDPHAAFSPLFYTQNGNEYRSASGAPGPKYWQNRADYSIVAELDELKHTVSGSITINYKNNSPDKLPFLWLQLDQNLFSPDSRGNALIASGSRYGSRGELLNGGYKIEGITVTKKMKPVKFTTLTEDTRMQIRLASAMAPGGDVISIKMNFSFVIPVNGSDRMGRLTTRNGEIFTIAQWFPRMSVYDDILGWNTVPYWGAGEFYCEYGDVDFTVTAPGSHIVMGSGELLNPQDVFTTVQLQRWNAAKLSDKTLAIRSEAEVTDPKSRPAKDKLTWKFRMKNTRDVAWASSKAFVLDAARINLPGGKKAMAVSAQPVESNGQDGYGRAVEYVKAAIEHYSDKWFEYPYPMAVNIASNVSGMEYPGIVFCGWNAKGAVAWGVIDHEVGHTWFPMIVGSNERKFGWMDEGFNTFINGLSAAAFNKGEYNAEPADMHRAAQRIANPAAEYIMLSPDAMKEANIGLNLYYKPGWGMEILRNEILGPDRFDYAFRNYIDQWAYKHPSPFDFFRSMENGAGEDLSWFWRGWFLENRKMDQAIVEVREAKGSIAGYDIVVANLEQMPMPIILEVTTKSGKKEVVRVRVDVWMRNKIWTVFYPTTEELVSVVLDPGKVLPDVNEENNSWKGK
ncbi:M1 family metallopeptidase [Pedobacter heparinus]|uniref:M1 family metallopeptidase n=1 Tax=Pedobacter heparinus TaxID=984 RepID=UPI00293016C7|nr:M1 family metallopeptidase [Pedobacter heparinus]